MEGGTEWILGFCSEMQEVQDMLIFVGESKRMWIESILIGLLSCERVLFEEVERLGFIMLDDVPHS